VLALSPTMGAPYLAFSRQLSAIRLWHDGVTIVFTGRTYLLRLS
jgi:hypothetical protein